MVDSREKPERKTALQAAIAVSLTPYEIFGYGLRSDPHYKTLWRQISPFSSYRMKGWRRKVSSWVSGFDSTLARGAVQGTAFLIQLPFHVLSGARGAVQAVVYGIELPLRLLSDGLTKLSNANAAWEERSGWSKVATVILAPLRLPVEALAFCWSHSGNLATRALDTIGHVGKLEGKKAWDSLKQVARHAAVLAVPAGIVTTAVMFPEVLSPIALRDLVLQLSGEAGAAIGTVGVVGVEMLAYLTVISVFVAALGCIYGVSKLDEHYTKDRVLFLKEKWKHLYLDAEEEVDNVEECASDLECDDSDLERDDSNLDVRVKPTYQKTAARFGSFSPSIDSEDDISNGRKSPLSQTSVSRHTTTASPSTPNKDKGGVSAFTGSAYPPPFITETTAQSLAEAQAKRNLEQDGYESDGVLYAPPSSPSPSPGPIEEE